VTSVAVLGAGAGGLATLVELSASGHDVSLWHPNRERLDRYRRHGVRFSGVLGDGVARPAALTDDLSRALSTCEVVVVSLPAFFHPEIFDSLARAELRRPVVLSPGHTGGALHMREVFRRNDVADPVVAELSTLPYVARVDDAGGVCITGRAQALRCGVLPGGDDAARAADALFSSELCFGDVLLSSLSNVNLVLHPPGALLGASWIEATHGAFTFYVEGVTPGVASVIEALDDERRALGGCFGLDLPRLVEEMARIGTVQRPLPAATSPAAQTAAAIASGEANRALRAPTSLAHRYYKEDFPFGLAPFCALAEVAGLDVPVAESLWVVGRVLAGAAMPPPLDRAALGLAGVGLDELIARVRS
jgi:opine dehydrogenase